MTDTATLMEKWAVIKKFSPEIAHSLLWSTIIFGVITIIALLLFFNRTKILRLKIKLISEDNAKLREVIKKYLSDVELQKDYSDKWYEEIKTTSALQCENRHLKEELEKYRGFSAKDAEIVIPVLPAPEEVEKPVQEQADNKRDSAENFYAEPVEDEETGDDDEIAEAEASSEKAESVSSWQDVVDDILDKPVIGG